MPRQHPERVSQFMSPFSSLNVIVLLNKTVTHGRFHRFLPEWHICNRFYVPPVFDTLFTHSLNWVLNRTEKQLPPG